MRSFISTSEVGSFCLGPFRSKKEKKVSMMMTRTKIKSEFYVESQNEFIVERKKGRSSYFARRGLNILSGEGKI